MYVNLDHSFFMNTFMDRVSYIVLYQSSFSEHYSKIKVTNFTRITTSTNYMSRAVCAMHWCAIHVMCMHYGTQNGPLGPVTWFEPSVLLVLSTRKVQIDYTLISMFSELIFLEKKSTYRCIFLKKNLPIDIYILKKLYGKCYRSTWISTWTIYSTRQKK